MSNTLEAIQFLEASLTKLISNYEFLKEENQVLLKQNSELQRKLIETEQKLMQQITSYDALKIAKTIEGSGTNTKDTKLKINSLIREIDKCIIQLQE